MELPSDGDKAEQTKSLAAKLGNLVIVRKGQIDIITDGEQGGGIIYHLYNASVLFCYILLINSDRV